MEIGINHEQQGVEESRFGFAENTRYGLATSCTRGCTCRASKCCLPATVTEVIVADVGRRLQMFFEASLTNWSHLPVRPSRGTPRPMQRESNIDTMPRNPQISILLPTYNRAPLLRGVLAGLLSQPLREIEIVVVDDGSQDNTRDVVTSFQDERVRYFLRNRTGATANVNEALNLSTGPYVLVLHDHDIYDPSMLVEFAAVLDRNPTAAFAFCGYIFVDSEAKAETQRWIHDWPELIDGREFLRSVLLPKINSPILIFSMIRRSFINERFLDPSVGACADVELWHRLASVADVAYIQRPLIKVRERDSSSLFHSAGTAVEMLAMVLNAKKPYLQFVPAGWQRRRMGLRWRSQVDRGGVYVLWKATEADDRNATKAMLLQVKREGTSAGYLLSLGLSCLPHRGGVSMLRLIRKIFRTISPKSGTKPS